MPIVRSYMCGDCGHFMTVSLTAEQWDSPPPECPRCSTGEMAQEFTPVAISTGSARAKAERIVEDIIDKDYNVGNIHRDAHEGSTPKVTYKDQGRPLNTATWGANREALETAIAVGRQTRIKHGTGLDVLQSALKSGQQPDLIELSKRRSMKVW